MSVLRDHFQSFIRDSCKLPSDYRTRVTNVYQHFFNTIVDVLEVISISESIKANNIKVKYDLAWILFTTNYDRCLETFWRGDAKVDLDTGFPNGKLDAATFLHPAQGKIRLVKKFMAQHHGW